MSELIYRSFRTPEMQLRQIGPYGGPDYMGSVSVKGFSYEKFYEAIVPDPERERFVVSLQDLETPKRELLVEIDKKLLQRLQMWKTFQHYKRWYVESHIRSGTSDVSIPVISIDHSVLRDELEPVMSYQEVPIDGLFDAISHPTNGLEQWWDGANEDELFVLDPPGLDSMVSRSIASLAPKVKTQVQLLNSLLEIKDFVTLKSTINRIRTLGLKIRSIKGAVGALRDIAGSVADMYLQTQFNISPLVRDIEGIHKALVDSLGRLRRLMAFDGVPQVTKYKRDLRERDRTTFREDPVASSWAIVGPTYDVAFHPGGTHSGVTVNLTASQFGLAQRTVTVSKDLFCAQLRFVARWSETQHRYAEQLGLIDALGLNWNPKFIWDAIPWSFVIDWVVKVGDFLDQFSAGALDPVLDVLDYSWSISRVREIKTSVRFSRFDINDLGRKIADKIVVYPTLYESAYRRAPIKAGRTALVVSGLSLKEMSLATALLLSRKRRLRKPKHRSRRDKRVESKLNRAK